MNKGTQTVGEYYADYDADSAMWCVFHTEGSSAYASFADPGDARDYAAKLNSVMGYPA